MPDEPTEEAAARAGANTWAWSGISFVIVENTLDLGDLDAVVSSIQPEFADVRVNRRVAGPGAGGLTPEAALLTVVTAIAIPFLAEAGKDAYRAFRSALFTVYKKAKTWANARGYAPVAVEIRYVAPEDQGSAEMAPEPNLFFVLRPGLDEEEFDRALKKLFADFASIPRSKPAWYVVLEWDVATQDWRVLYAD